MADNTVKIRVLALPSKIQKRMTDSSYFGMYLAMSIHDVIKLSLLADLTPDESQAALDLWVEEFRLNSVVQGVENYLGHGLHK